MTFTMAAPGTVLSPPRPPQARLPRLGKVWKEYTPSGFYEPVKAVTEDGEWLFVRAADGTWSAGHLPTETVVRAGRRSLGACRTYVGSGEALEDLERIQAEGKSGNA
jgi:hypothetical protein